MILCKLPYNKLIIIMDQYISTPLQIVAISAFILTLIINYYILKKFKYDTTIYYLSTVHAIFATTYGYVGFNNLQDINESSTILIICGHVTLGYFLVDMISIIKKSAVGSYVFILHHIGFSILLIWSIYWNKYHMFSLFGLFTELSTIFLNSYHLIKHYSKSRYEYKKYIKLQVILFAIAFFLVRIVFLTNIVIEYFDVIIHDQILIISALFSLGINYWWFWKLMQKIKYITLGY